MSEGLISAEVVNDESVPDIRVFPSIRARLDRSCLRMSTEAFHISSGNRRCNDAKCQST